MLLSSIAPDAPQTSGALARYQTSDGAARYSGKYGRSWTRRRTAQRESALLREFLGEFEPGASVLNVPCGTGRFADVLAPERRSRVVFADFSQTMLDATRAAVPVVKARAIELRLEDATKPFAGEPFDLVLCVRLLHHLESREVFEAAVAHLTAGARKGIICTFASSSTWKGSLRNLRKRLGLRRGGETLRSASDLKDAFAARGWRVVRTRLVSALFSTQTWMLLVPAR